MKTPIIIVIACIVCAVLCWWPQKPQLLSVAEIQQELVNRGHDIKVDGKYGKNTDLALTIEITKEQ